MSISHNVNGTYRETWTASVNVNGVWRDSDVWNNVNGVWRQSFKNEINEEDIIGFRIVYKRNPYKKHPDFPNLSFNPDLPVLMHTTGDTAGFMDTNQKGIVFEYDRTYPDREGILMYEGSLYAVLANDQIINVGQTKEYSGDDERIPSNIPGITEVWSTNKIYNLDIKIEGYLLFESNGYYMAGWNSLFNKTQFIDPTQFPDDSEKDRHLLNSYVILPIENRESAFDSISSIGIARDMHSADANMIGSYGVLDHTIYWITVNGVSKPFVFEIYD